MAVHRRGRHLAVASAVPGRRPPAAPFRDPQRGHHRLQPGALRRTGWLLAARRRHPHAHLAGRARGSVGRLAAALASRDAAPAGDWILAGYSALNGIVAVGLLATAGFFWYQLFGGLAGALARHGPAGWLALAAAAVILARPAITAAAPSWPPPPGPPKRCTRRSSSGCNGGGGYPQPAASPQPSPGSPPSTATS